MRFLRKARKGRVRRAPVARYLAATFAVCLLALGTLMTSTAVSSFGRERDRTTALLVAAARYNAGVQAEDAPRAEQLLLSVAGEPAVTSFDPAACRVTLGGLMSLTARAHLHLLRHDGSQVCTLLATGLPDRPVPAGPWFQQVLATGMPTVAGPEVDDVSGQPAITVAVPVGEGPGTAPTATAGALVAVVSTAATPLAVPPGDSPTMVIIQLSPDRSLVLSASPTAPVHPGRVTESWLSQAPSGGTRTVIDSDGNRRVYREVTGPLGWPVLAGLPYAVALGPAVSELVRNLALTAVVLLIVASMGALLNRRLAWPIRRLQRAIEEAARDELARAPVEGPAEVAALAEAFNVTISQRRQLTQQLAHQALHDPLTDLPNRTLLIDRLNLALLRSRRSGGWVALTFVDLDHFKTVNDTYGHAAGDRVLKDFARRLTAAMRSSDTVARLGGDEFVIVSEGSSNPAAETIAERVRSCFTQSFVVDGRELTLSASIGIAIGDGSNTADELIATADRIMYQAKQHERRSYALYDRPVRADQAMRREIERDLREGIGNDELVLHYQPVCRLSNSEIASVEALVRWRSAARGLLHPEDFIPLAEESGIIQMVGEQVLAEACRQCAAWRDLLGRAVPVSVNLSARQLARPDLTDVVAKSLEASGIDPGDLCIEIPQGALIIDANVASRRLNELRGLGVRLSIDDFGTAQSSLIAHLRTLPIHEIKIDRSFIAGVGHQASAAAIVGGVVTVGHALGLSVVAEGVETARQFEVLRDLACDTAQGYYLSTPLPAEELTPLLRSPDGRLARFPRERATT